MIKNFLRVMPGLVLAIVVGLYNPAEAASSQGLTISPPTYELNVNPGDTLQNTIRVTNDSENAVTLQVSAQDFKVGGTEGSVSVLDSAADPAAFSKWFHFPTSQLQLAPKASALVPFTIAVPKKAEPGGHFATVLFSPVVTANATSTGARVVQRVGSLILMRVSGAVKEQGSIEAFHTKTFKGSWQAVTGSDGKTKINVVSAEDLRGERAQGYFSKGPVAFDVLFKNSGNIHVMPAGTVTIYDAFGNKVDHLTLNPRNVFPGGERRITVIWPKTDLWGGYYRAQVAAVYGSQNKILTAETRFWAFPLIPLLIMLGGLVLLVVLRRRLLSAARILIKGR
ncbi:MAG TPA: hypothetical protein VMR98_04175 [Candidatus Polarisedimenticolaceae bacterium]|nr:hypothetical protein [Candidatus Polarisedimenticolaceae bacterium]